jgi:hypothetical protein
MFCYGDTTFCMASQDQRCDNTKCHAYFSPLQYVKDCKAANFEYPVAWCDFSPDCEYFNGEEKLDA